MRVFLTGVDGCIGAVSRRYLLARGMQVIGLDTGYYRDGWLFSDNARLAATPQTLHKDLRRVTAADLAGCDAVVHLAELSNDPLGQNNPTVTRQINHRGSVDFAQHRSAPASGASSTPRPAACTGREPGNSSTRNRPSIRRPRTRSARYWSSAIWQRWRAQTLSPVFLRNATAYGPSPRMRFDIVINDLCALAWTTQRIAMISDGSPWRPVVHVEDICEAIYRSLIAPADAVRGRIFNVGQNSENYRVRELADIVAGEFPGCEVTVGPSSGDSRAATASTSTASTATCRASLASSPARRGAPAASAVRADSADAGHVWLPRLHPAQAAAASAATSSSTPSSTGTDMRFESIGLVGAALVKLERHSDERGFFARSACSHEFAAQGLTGAFVQSSMSCNPRRGTVRGLHFQWAPSTESKLVRCVRGSIHDVLLDLRPDQPTYLQLPCGHPGRGQPRCSVRPERRGARLPDAHR